MAFYSPQHKKWFKTYNSYNIYKEIQRQKLEKEIKTDRYAKKQAEYVQNSTLKFNEIQKKKKLGLYRLKAIRGR